MTRVSNYPHWMKRMLDLLGTIGLLIFLSPVFLIVTLMVRFSSRGPIFFRQTRLGLSATPFIIFKFRTMIPHEATSLADKLVHAKDNRITPVGHFLRDFRLDELPQLFNVFRGEMSLVGPRPLTPDFYGHYSERDKRRLEVAPGVTGWQQVNGASRHTWAQRIDLDIWYVDNASLLLDVKILLRTVSVALSRSDVYNETGSQLSGVPEALLSVLKQSSPDENIR